VLQTFTDDMMACMDAADLVISMGGYNTVCELLTLGKRAIVVPRVEPVTEQWIRAERMAKLGLLRTIHPEEMTPSLLMEIVKEELAEVNVRPHNFYQINLNGLSGVCSSICKLMDEDQDAANPAIGKQSAKIQTSSQQRVQASRLFSGVQ
jgi:predicted glycosyltransferase